MIFVNTVVNSISPKDIIKSFQKSIASKILQFSLYSAQISCILPWLTSPVFNHGLAVGLPGGDEYLVGFFLGVFKRSRFCVSNKAVEKNLYLKTEVNLY